MLTQCYLPHQYHEPSCKMVHQYCNASGNHLRALQRLHLRLQAACSTIHASKGYGTQAVTILLGSMAV